MKKKVGAIVRSLVILSLFLVLNGSWVHARHGGDDEGGRDRRSERRDDRREDREERRRERRDDRKTNRQDDRSERRRHNRLLHRPDRSREREDIKNPTTEPASDDSSKFKEGAL